VIEGYARAVASGRVVGIVALCAAAAVAVIVGGTLLLSRHESTTPAGAVTTPRPGKPLLQLELGLRRDAEAQALDRARNLLDRDAQTAQAAAIFRRYSSVEARLGLAFATWTGPESLATVKQIADSAPDSSAALFNLGLADFQAGRNADAVSAWQQTASRFPDSPYAVDALDALSGEGVAPGLPPIVIDPAAVPARARPALVAGWRAWQLKHVVSARRELDRAAQLAPNSPETLVAAAVSRFSPDAPKAPFGLLGPLTATFPHDSIVRLHLGVLLLWRREIAKGKEQLRLAVAEQPSSVYAKQARRLLEALGHK
jgi:tetratricopeptide (TPR) repeat protein